MLSPTHSTLGGALILLLALLTGLGTMAINLYLLGMPAIASDLNAPPGRIQQALPVFLIGLVLGQALYCPLPDLYGRLLGGLVVFRFAARGFGTLPPNVFWSQGLCKPWGAAGLVAPGGTLT